MSTNYNLHLLYVLFQETKDVVVPAGDQVAKKAKPSTFPLGQADLSGQERTNRIDTNWKSIDFSCTKTCANGGEANFKIASWNIAGIRACIKVTSLQIYDLVFDQASYDSLFYYTVNTRMDVR